jgi:hypothetical protein
VVIVASIEGLNVKRFAFAGAAAALTMIVAGSASAATTFFVPDGASPQANFTVIDNFNTNVALTGVLNTDYIITTSHTLIGAPPANSIPYDTPYLSVLSGGTASIDFTVLTGAPVRAFEFDWGSIDYFNTLTIHSNQGDIVIVPGTSSFPNAADGNQVAAGTNGLFRVDGDAGQVFTGMTLQSSGYSFEIDNLATGAVPEPATWAMMIVGMGLVGMSLRSRRQALATFA